MKDMIHSTTRLVFVLLTIGILYACFASNVNSEAFKVLETAYSSMIGFYFIHKAHIGNDKKEKTVEKTDEKVENVEEQKEDKSI